jgi:hypothetical protein
MASRTEENSRFLRVHEIVEITVSTRRIFCDLDKCVRLAARCRRIATIRKPRLSNNMQAAKRQNNAEGSVFREVAKTAKEAKAATNFFLAF